MFDAVATARRFAEAQPDALWPCPHCGNGVKGVNLAGHLAKVHGGAAAPTANILRGADRAVFTTAFLAMAAVAALTVPVVLGVARSDNPAVYALPLSLAWVAVLGLGLFDKLPARIELHADRIKLRAVLGVRSRTARIPSAVEVGSLIEKKADMALGGYQGDTNTPGVDTRVGSYVHIAGPRPLTIGCKQDRTFPLETLGATRGEQRRRWHITLPREAYIALQYALLASKR